MVFIRAGFVRRDRDIVKCLKVQILQMIGDLSFATLHSIKLSCIIKKHAVICPDLQLTIHQSAHRRAMQLYAYQRRLDQLGLDNVFGNHMIRII
jgi:hypothetical protein